MVAAAAVAVVEDAVGTEITTTRKDRVGLAWRPELAAGIFAHQDQIDVLEVIAEDWFDTPRPRLSALKTLAAQIPLQLHGISAGMASAVIVEEHRLAKMAHLVDWVQPEAWSEHLAFVRASGVDIGHLAAPPRTPNTVESSAENVYRSSRIVGMTPMVENIATLIDPPASTMSEVDWLSKVVTASGAPLLLDLHNLYANAVNFGCDSATTPLDALRTLPQDRVGTVHIAGGRWLGAGRQFPDEYRLLDDHLHPVPDTVFVLLEDLAAHTSQSLTVILERDGAFPTMEDLLLELDLARAAMRRGRVRNTPAPKTAPYVKDESPCGASSPQLETLLARIYTDDVACAAFLSDPREFARSHGLPSREARALASIDRLGLGMAARSFARKREANQVRSAHENWFDRMLRELSRSFTSVSR